MADEEKKDKTALIIGEEEYQLNQRRIEEARRYIDNWDAMNEQAKKEYDRMQEDLQNKIQEGEEARRLLKAMQEQQATRKQQLAIAGPSGQHGPQATNRNHTNLLSITSAPSTTSRLEEIPPANHVPQQSHPTVSPSNTYSSTHAPTPTQTWQYHSNVAQPQRYANVHMSGVQPNWTSYASATPYNGYPTQSGPSVVAGAPLNVSQSVPQQKYGQLAPTQVWPQQQQIQVPQGQPLHTRPAQGSSTGMQQGSYSVAQPKVKNLPLQQQGMMFTKVQQQGNTYLTHHQPRVQGTTPQPLAKLNSYPNPPAGTVATSEQTRQFNSGQQQSLNDQAKAPMTNPASTASFTQASSSLAGALGMTTKASTTTLNSDLNRGQLGLSRANLESLKEQRSTISNSQMTFRTGPIPAASSLSMSAKLQVDSQASPGSASSMARLRTLITNWERDGPPQSYFELPGAKVKIYKDKASKVYLVTPDKKGGYAYIGASSLDDIFSTISQDASKTKTKATVYPNITGHVQNLKDTLTAGSQATVYSSYEEPPRQPSAQGVISLGEPQPVEPSNSQPAPPQRTPKDADKAHLARDILRALTEKRPRPKSVSIPSQEPLAKPHAPDVRAGETLDGAIPNTVRNSSISSGLPPAFPQPESVSTAPYQPPDLGPTLSPSHSQSVFQVRKQVPTMVPPSMAILKPTTFTNMVPPLSSTVDMNKFVSAPHPATISPVLPAIQSPFTKETLPPTLNSVPSSSRLSTPQFEPIPNQPPPLVAEPESDNNREKTPLFLPSPSSSPSLQASRAVSVGFDVGLSANTRDKISAYPESVDSKGNVARKRQSCYVLVPPIPKYVKRFKAKQRVSIKEDTVWYTSVPASDGFVINEIQGEAVQLSCSRLSKRPCRLDGCDAMLNSTQALLDHISQEHRPKRVRCQWPQCGRQYRDSKVMFYHIRSHALIPLGCAYEDCQESFRTPQQLVRHHEAVHRNSSLKHAAALFTPELSPLPAAPESLPAYMVEARQVQPPSISKDRHHMLGPWVLRNISGPVDLKTKRYNAALPLRSQNREQMERRPGNQPYDFMTYPSTNFSTTLSQPAKLPTLDDLPSAVVSEMTHDGMVLWQAPEVKVENPAAEIGQIESRATTDELTLSNGLNQMLGTQTPLSRGDNHSDEEAVENMLTG